MTFIKDLLTESNNQTFCPIRAGSYAVGALYHLAALAGIGLGSIRLDITTLGMYLQHMIMLIGAAGTTVTLKSRMGADAPAPASQA